MRPGAVSITNAIQPAWVVYQLFDRDGSLLYVGSTGSLRTRLTKHRRTDWGSQIHSVRTEEFPDREAALDSEKATIKRYRPPFNVTHNPEGPRPVTATSSVCFGPVKNCSLCGAMGLVWATGRLGRAYLCEASIVQKNGRAVGNRHELHRCPARENRT